VDRLALRVALALAALAFASPAAAQPIPALHVRSFVLALDKTSVNVGDDFHLRLTTHVDERISTLENVVLPNLSSLEDLGDERRCSAGKKGTECVETLTLDANGPGDRTIGPATLEILDPQTGRPHNITSNLVTIHVTGQAKTGSQPPPSDVLAAVTGGLVSLLRNILVFILVAVAGWGFIWGLRHRQPPPPPIAVAPVPAPAPGPVVDWATQFAQLSAALELEPTRPRALAVREALRRYLGARDEETLADLVNRNAANGKPKLLAALGAVERAVFCEDSRIAEAVREALPYLKS
jgi:hypothetical protein